MPTATSPSSRCRQTAGAARAGILGFTLVGLLGCSGLFDMGLLQTEQTYTEQDALDRVQRKLGSVPDHATDALYVLDGFQDPFSNAEFRAPQADAIAWFDALVLPCPTDTSDFEQFVGATQPREGFSHPAQSDWPAQRCRTRFGTSYTVKMQPSGDPRWIVFSWYTM